MPKSVFDREVKIKTPAQMFARLNERVLGAQEQGAPQIKLHWQKVDAYALQSTCGKYSVFKTTVHEETTYSAARLTGLRGLIAGHLKSGAEAKAVAQAYADSLVSQVANVPR